MCVRPCMLNHNQGKQYHELIFGLHKSLLNIAPLISRYFQRLKQTLSGLLLHGFSENHKERVGALCMVHYFAVSLFSF